MNIETRLKELELIALKNMSGEEIEQQLFQVDPKLCREYQKLMSELNGLGEEDKLIEARMRCI